VVKAAASTCARTSRAWLAISIIVPCMKLHLLKPSRLKTTERCLIVSPNVNNHVGSSSFKRQASSLLQCCAPDALAPAFRMYTTLLFFHLL
jgi:hypothetical protein